MQHSSFSIFNIGHCIFDWPVAMYFWCGLSGHVCISGHVFLQLSSSPKHLTSILPDKSSWQTDRTVHPPKSMAGGHLKIKEGTRTVLILATWCHTTESVLSTDVSTEPLGRRLMILGGGRKENWGKNIKGPSPGENAFVRKGHWRDFQEEKKLFPIFFLRPPPRLLMVEAWISSVLKETILLSAHMAKLKEAMS